MRNGSHCSRNAGLLSRSGPTRSTSSSSASTCSRMRSHSVTFAEFTMAARTPARDAAATWSRMSESSGEMMSAGPVPRARRSSEEMK
mgnify:CR=1 FL=1